MEPQPADLQFTTRYINGHPVITVTGEIDICTTPAMHAYLLDADTTSRNGGRDLVADLGAVTFMDASGLTVLLRADHRARRAGGHLRLAAPTARITRLLAITDLDLYFDLYPTSEAATAVPASAGSRWPLTPDRRSTSRPMPPPALRSFRTARPPATGKGSS